MANPVCLSPLKIYDDVSKQCHRKSYAYEHISPLVTPVQCIPAFQFIIPENWYIYRNDLTVHLIDVKTDELITEISSDLIDTGFTTEVVDGFSVAVYYGNSLIEFDEEGRFYLEFISRRNSQKYYSEVFCFTQTLDGFLEIEYWNSVSNFYLKNGVVSFLNNFHFRIYLRSEIGKPEYQFEEESTKRLGYNFIESQVSKKVYKFNTIVPEFICDAMRIIRLCDNKIIRCNGDEYDAITFELEADWQTQGDLASVTCEFETDNIVVNLGGFTPV